MNRNEFCIELYKLGWFYNGMNYGPSFTLMPDECCFLYFRQPPSNSNEDEYEGDDKIHVWNVNSEKILGMFVYGKFDSYDKCVEYIKTIPLKKSEWDCPSKAYLMSDHGIEIPDVERLEMINNTKMLGEKLREDMAFNDKIARQGINPQFDKDGKLI